MQQNLDNATIDYEEHGAGKPILFLHGWTMDRRLEVADYERIFSTRPGWRRIYPDLPGMGHSIAKPGLTCQDDMLATLLAFIERVLPGERFVLAGTSLGGYLARAIAVRLRPRIRGLLLRVPAVIPDTARRSLPAAGLAALSDAYEHKMRTLVQPAIDATAPLVHEIKADPARYSLSFDLAGAEKGFSAPTLILAGRQDTTVGYRDAWDIVESYPRATFAVIDGADHVWPVDDPGVLDALVDDWLRRIEQG
ncbi:MAG: alpha/beta hydrolase [Alphaproteobacteria bacterium]|nr:alpha/beta hydrolase [Alphaproteobacteria bacterium]